MHATASLSSKKAADASVAEKAEKSVAQPVVVQGPETYRVVLHPNEETLWTEMRALNEKLSGGTWAEEEALAIESKILVSTRSAQPSPRSKTLIRWAALVHASVPRILPLPLDPDISPAMLGAGPPCNLDCQLDARSHRTGVAVRPCPPSSSPKDSAADTGRA